VDEMIGCPSIIDWQLSTWDKCGFGWVRFIFVVLVRRLSKQPTDTLSYLASLCNSFTVVRTVNPELWPVSNSVIVCNSVIVAIIVYENIDESEYLLFFL
jgi:hypothetical protein